MLTFVKAFRMPKDACPNLNSRFEYEGLKTYINQESVGNLQQHDSQHVVFDMPFGRFDHLITDLESSSGWG